MKEKYSTSCIAGFVFSVVIPIPAVVIAFFCLSNLHKYALYASGMKIAMGSVIAGFIVSLIGVIITRKSDVKGRKLGLIGLVFSIIEVICFVVFLGIVFWIGSGTQMSN